MHYCTFPLPVSCKPPPPSSQRDILIVRKERVFISDLRLCSWDTLWFPGSLSLCKSCHEHVCVLYTAVYTPLWIYRHVEWSHCTLIRSNVSAWITMPQCDMVQSLNGLESNLEWESRGQRRADVMFGRAWRVYRKCGYIGFLMHMQSRICFIHMHISFFSPYLGLISLPTPSCLHYLALLLFVFT